MTITDTTDREQSEALAFEIDLPHAPERIWRALTVPELLAEWLLPVIGLELRTGAAFQLRRDPMPGWDGIVNCRVIDVDAPRRLSYAWVAGEIDTVVTFTLVPSPSGTRLLIVQSGFKPHQKQNFGGARYGWRMMGGKLVDLLSRPEDT